MRHERTNGRNQIQPAESGRTTRARPVMLRPVWFEYTNDASRELTIAGSFNNWDVSSTHMVRADRGRWVRLLFLPPGRYEYLLVVDGLCVADPQAAESVPNVFGCQNSVLHVPARAPKNGCARHVIGSKTSLVRSKCRRRRLHNNATSDFPLNRKRK